MPRRGMVPGGRRAMLSPAALAPSSRLGGVRGRWNVKLWPVVLSCTHLNWGLRKCSVSSGGARNSFGTAGASHWRSRCHL